MDISPDNDRKCMANTKADFELDCKGAIKGKGVINGTTYSGHPTATTLMGTYRNFLYHCFAFF
jgi:hypothetical protein